MIFLHICEYVSHMESWSKLSRLVGLRYVCSTLVCSSPYRRHDFFVSEIFLRGVHLFRSSRNNPASYRWRSPHIRASFPIPFPRVHIHASSRFYLQSEDGAILTFYFLPVSPLFGMPRIEDTCVSLIRFVYASFCYWNRGIIAKRILTLIVRLRHNKGRKKEF